MPSEEKPLNDQEPREPASRAPYETPRILKKREVRRVTLFSGGGVATTGLTTSG